MKKFLPILSILLGWTLFIGVNTFSVYYSLYWYFWWFDIIMHTVGGFLIVASWFQVKRIGAFSRLMSQSRYQPLFILWGIMIVWELFEFKFGLITEYGYVADTLADFFNGLAGGLIAFWLNQSRTMKE